jgi:hypothetical protein
VSTGRALRVRSTTPQTAMRAGGATCPQPPRPTLDALARDRSRCDLVTGSRDRLTLPTSLSRAAGRARGPGGGAVPVAGAERKLEGRSGFRGNFAC